MKERTGDEVNLIESSLRAVAGTTVSTTLYVLSGILYTAATSPEVAGKALFVVLVVILVLRPVRGLSQTLHKVGSEKGERVSSYLSICILFSIVYVSVLGVCGSVFVGVFSAYTIFEPQLFAPAFLIATAKIPDYVTQGLLGAIGRPGYTTWVTSTRDFLITAAVLGLMPVLTTVYELLVLLALIRVILFPPILLYIGVVPSIPTAQELYRAYEYAKWSIPDQIVDILGYNLPTLVLGAVATPLAVAVYEVADRFADFGVMVCYQLAGVLLTKVSGDWSSTNTNLDYVDSSVTGGVGITFVVLGYLIASADVISEIVFPEASNTFSVVVVLVGLINIFRGFWTLVSFVMEGINQPSVSLKTKLYALLVSLPLIVVLGDEFGAIGGAVGYALLNLGIFCSVIWFSYDYFERLLINWDILRSLMITLILTVLVTRFVIVIIEPAFNMIVISTVGVLTSIVSYAGCMSLLSEKASYFLNRAYHFYRARIRDIFL